MKKSMHVKQKINKPKVDKHVDFVIYINTTGEGGFLDHGSVKDMCKFMFHNKNIKFINESTLPHDFAMRDLCLNHNHIVEWIKNCEAVLYYISTPDWSNSADSYIAGLCAAYSKNMISLMSHSLSSDVTNPWLTYISGMEDDYNFARIGGSIGIEVERKFLISEDLYYKMLELKTNNTPRKSLYITQTFDNNMVRYRELSNADIYGNPIIDDEDQYSIYIKEIKSNPNLFKQNTPTSTKIEVGIPISKKSYIAKFKEFKRYHEYERPIKKHRISYSYYDSDIDAKISIEFDKIKISTHTMYVAEIELYKNIISTINHSNDLGLDDLKNIKYKCKYLNGLIDKINNINFKEICENEIGLSVSDSDYYLISPKDNINNQRIMRFITDHTDQENYLKFIEFMKYCNSKCKGSVIKTLKSLHR